DPGSGAVRRPDRRGRGDDAPRRPPRTVRRPRPQGRGGRSKVGVRASGDGTRGEHTGLEGGGRGRRPPHLRDQGDAGEDPRVGAERRVVVRRRSLLVSPCRGYSTRSALGAGMSNGPWTSDRGPLVVVSGPSGVGKTTVVEELLKTTTLPLRRAITATTRNPRPGEERDVSYHFWTPEQFAKAKAELLESAVVHGKDSYGTPRSEVDPFRADGEGVILVIDVQGAEQVRE